MSACSTHNSSCRVPLRIFAVGVVEGGEAAACAHLNIGRVNFMGHEEQRDNKPLADRRSD